MINPHNITVEFEKALCEYTGSPYAVAVDNCSNALFLALMWYRRQNEKVTTISIPKHTYPSVPCEIIHAGLKVNFANSPEYLTGAYNLFPSNVYDCALRFTHGMYVNGQIQCLSFTGPYKHLKLGKGGAILTDDVDAYNWFKRSRFSGRRECSYHDEHIDMLGWNFYMMPEIAARGVLLLSGMQKDNEDLQLKYPDLSKFKVYDTNNW